MSALFASGQVVDAILVLVLAEAVALTLWHGRTGRGVAPGALLPMLLAGAFLLLAMRLALAGAAWPFVGAALFGGLLAHLLDLRRRWR